MSAPRLLQLDDDPDIGALVQRVAEEVGYEAAGSATAPDFLAAHDRLQPDVIVLDLGMPDADGIEVLQELAARRSASRILLFSGFHNQMLESAQRLGRARGLRMAGVLRKPTRVDALRTLLVKALTEPTGGDAVQDRKLR